MNKRRAAVMHRAQIERACAVADLPVRHLGGELIIGCGNRAFRLGGRHGVDRVLLKRMLKRMRDGNCATERFLTALGLEEEVRAPRL